MYALVCLYAHFMYVYIFLSQNIILDYNNNDTSNILLLFIVWEERVLDIIIFVFRVSSPK